MKFNMKKEDDNDNGNTISLLNLFQVFFYFICVTHHMYINIYTYSVHRRPSKEYVALYSVINIIISTILAVIQSSPDVNKVYS